MAMAENAESQIEALKARYYELANATHLAVYELEATEDQRKAYDRFSTIEAFEKNTTTLGMLLSLALSNQEKDDLAFFILSDFNAKKNVKTEYQKFLDSEWERLNKEDDRLNEVLTVANN